MTRALNTRIAALCGLVACALAIGASATSQAASTSTSVVGATVLSSTTIDAAACASGVLGRTDFGPVTAGSSNVTTLDCDIRFGSSNDTAQLRVRQSDALGVAMYSPSRGKLDMSFDGDGIVTTAIAPGAGDDVANAVVVQSDGKVVMAGKCEWPLEDTCLARYNSDGSLDTTFDSDGRVNTDVSTFGFNDRATAVAIQADGRIVVAGYCYTGGATSEDFCLARYNTSGSLDTTFDTDGRVNTAIAPGASADQAYGVAIQPDGRIVAAGNCEMGGATGRDVCLARFNVNGSLDTTFDGDGRVVVATALGAGTEGAWGIGVQPNGSIVTAGYCQMGATGVDACLTRFNPNGSLDTTFDTDGIATTAISPGAGSDYGTALAIQPDGRVVETISCSMGGATGGDFCLARYNPNGSLDTTFDTDGIVSSAIAPGNGFDEPYGVAFQAEGKIVATGACAMGGATSWDTCLARFNTDGSLDNSFDSDGRVTTATSPGANWDAAYGVAVVPDGRIVTAGECYVDVVTGWDSCLVSYAANGTLQQYADDGVRDWDTAGAAPNLFGACLRAVSGGASAQWATSATCPATDGAYWNAVSTSGTKVAYTTALEPDPPDATASLRFGLRAAGSQPAGVYLAPITFDVLAPNV